MVFDPTRSIFEYSLVMAVFFLVFILACWFSQLRSRFNRVGRLVAMGALILVAVQGMLFFPPVAKVLASILEIDQAISTEQLEQAQAIVIVGGGTEWVRAQYGSELQSRSGLPILVTGGNPTGAGSEAENMKKVIEQHYNGQVRWVESASRNTSENALLSSKLLDCLHITRIALVTDSWHMARAARVFRRQGLIVYTAPVVLTELMRDDFNSILPSLAALRSNMRVAREFLGILSQIFTKKYAW